jgi:hypothetical protein
MVQPASTLSDEPAAWPSWKIHRRLPFPKCRLLLLLLPNRSLWFEPPKSLFASALRGNGGNG